MDFYPIAALTGASAMMHDYNIHRWFVNFNTVRLHKFYVAGVFIWPIMEINFIVFFWEEKNDIYQLLFTSWKISILAEAIAGWRSPLLFIFYIEPTISHRWHFLKLTGLNQNSVPPISSFICQELSWNLRDYCSKIVEDRFWSLKKCQLW